MPIRLLYYRQLFIIATEILRKSYTAWEHLNLNKISFKTNLLESYRKHVTDFWLNS